MTIVSVLSILVAVVAGAALVGFGLWRIWGERDTRTEGDFASLAGNDPEEVADMIGARIGDLLAKQQSHQAEALAALRADLQGVKADVEWLAGERMIEQAIALAQSGSTPDAISEELGLSRENAAAIALFRRH